MLSLSVVLHARMSRKRLASSAFLIIKMHTELIHYRNKSTAQILPAECSPWHTLDFHSQTEESARMPSQQLLWLAWIFQDVYRLNSSEVRQHANVQMIHPRTGVCIDIHKFGEFPGCRSAKSSEVGQHANMLLIHRWLKFCINIHISGVLLRPNTSERQADPTPLPLHVWYWPKTCSCSLWLDINTVL